MWVILKSTAISPHSEVFLYETTVRLLQAGWPSVRLSELTASHCIISYCFKPVVWLMRLWSLRFVNTICVWKWNPGVAAVNSCRGLENPQTPCETAAKPQQSAVSNTNRARPHGNSIILIVNRTPALQITVSKLPRQHTTTLSFRGPKMHNTRCGVRLHDCTAVRPAAFLHSASTSKKL